MNSQLQSQFTLTISGLDRNVIGQLAEVRQMVAWNDTNFKQPLQIY